MLLGRKLFHTQGKDITYPGQKAFLESDYWLEFIPNIIREWRFHIVGGKSIQRQLKVPSEELKAKPWKFFRNRSTGWVFTRQTESLSKIPELRDLAKKAVTALNYDFGAVDLVETGEGNIFLLEVNKAPGLDELSASKYAEALIKLGMEKLTNE